MRSGRMFASPGAPLRRSPAYALTAMVVLALGIGANTAVFTVVKGALLAPLGYPDADRLVRIWSSHPERGLEFFSVSVADYLDWRRARGAFTVLGAFENERGVPLTSTVGQPEEVLAARVTPELFSVLGTPTLLGRSLGPEDVRLGESPVVVLSHEFWRSHLGEDAAAIGRALHVDGVPYTVVGVMPASFTIPGDDAVIWTPLDVHRAEPAGDRGARFLRVLGRLGPGADLARASAELATLAGRLAEAHPATNGGWTVNVRPIREVVVGDDFRRAILVVFGAVGLVLLIACANVANLSVTRMTARRRELALRAALGASRRRLVLLLLGETALLAVAAAALALLIATWGVVLLPRVGPASIPRLDAIRLDRGVFAFTTAVSCVAILLSGLVPALTASRGSASEALNAGTRGTLHSPIGTHARRAAVIGQLGLATLLVVGATLLVRSFLNLREVDLGFEPRRVLTARINLGEGRYTEPAQVVSFYRRLIEGLQATHGVAAVGAVTSVPFGPGNSGNLFAPEGMVVDRANAPDTDYRVIAGDYFLAMGIPLLAGRTFRTDDNGAQSVIVSRVIADRYWPGEDPIGRRIRFSHPQTGPLFTIVGVVGDARYRGLDQPNVRPMMYFSHASFRTAEVQRSMTLVLQGEADATAVVEPLRAQLARLDPNQPFATVEPMASIVDGVLAGRRFNTFLLTGFAGLALLLAAMGAYAILAYLVAQRRHEIAVRMALGARRQSVAMSVLLEGLVTAGVGLSAGMLAALFATRPLRGLLYGVHTRDVATLAGVSAILLLAAAVASYLPARRAARIEPMEALRGE